MQLYHLPQTPEEPAPFCPTPASDAMIRTIDIAIRIGFISAIIAPPGAGKTTTLKHYAETHAGARYCVMSPTTRSMSAMLELVSNALNGWAFRGNLTMETAICDKMKHPGFRVLLVDEAQHLPDKCLNQLRCIYDKTETVIVFAGNRSLLERINSDSEESFAQFAARLDAPLHLKSVSAADVGALAAHHGIAGADAVEWLKKQCVGTTGGLRRFSHVLKAARGMGNGKIGLAELKTAAAALGW